MNKINKLIAVAALIVFLSSNSMIFCAHASATVTSTQVANYFNSLVGNSWAEHKCLNFVATGFQNLGGGYSSTCCAYNYGSSHIQSTDINSIPVGADVYFGTCGGGPCETCHAAYYGHVGVYVGGGVFCTC